MVEKCGFCSRTLTSILELTDHYANSHDTTKDNSPVFERYMDLLTNPSSEFFMEECEHCGKTFFDRKLKAKHFFRKHLKLNGNNNILILRIGNRFIEFCIDYDRFKNVYDFFDLDKIIGSFIEAVARKIPDEEGEFRTVFSIINQSAAEIEGKRINSNTIWRRELVLGRMKDQRVKEFLYLNTKKRVLINGENGSNIYFHRFIFLKVHFITSALAQYNKLITKNENGRLFTNRNLIIWG